jgi:hypothetical protein
VIDQQIHPLAASQGRSHFRILAGGPQDGWKVGFLLACLQEIAGIFHNVPLYGIEVVYDVGMVTVLFPQLVDESPDSKVGHLAVQLLELFLGLSLPARFVVATADSSPDGSTQP